MATHATRFGVLRWVPAAAGAIVVAALVIAVIVRQPTINEPNGPTSPLLENPGAPPTMGAGTAFRPIPAMPAAPVVTPALPSFDVVRVSPDGSAVLAGRAAPGDEVIIRDGGKELGRAQAGADGAWVLVPKAPLAGGSHDLTVAAIPLTGGAPRMGAGSVVVAVPAHPGTELAAAAQVPLAVTTGPAGPRVLQGTGIAKPGTLGLQGLDYNRAGDMRFAGTAPPGAHLRIYLDNRPAGEAVAGADGLWTLAPSQPLPPGTHRLRLDQLGSGGQVLSRLEYPFVREDLTGRELRAGSVVVQPGESLWRIARSSYGVGTRFTVIFEANRGTIRNPNLIYPGQMFNVPGGDNVAAPLETAGPSAR